MPPVGPGPGPISFPGGPGPSSDPESEPELIAAPKSTVGALGDYGGNHGDLSPGVRGEFTDFYFGGNGTGVIISARPTCSSQQRVDGWLDKVRSKDIADGLSKTFLIGEMHVARSQLGQYPNDGPIYCGSEVNYAARVVGPGVRLALGPDDISASNYAFGSWHSEVCNFVNVDGSVRSVSVYTDTQLLGNMGHRNDGVE